MHDCLSDVLWIKGCFRDTAAVTLEEAFWSRQQGCLGITWFAYVSMHDPTCLRQEGGLANVDLRAADVEASTIQSRRLGHAQDGVLRGRVWG